MTTSATVVRPGPLSLNTIRWSRGTIPTEMIASTTGISIYLSALKMLVRCCLAVSMAACKVEESIGTH